MPNSKISALTSATTPLAGTETLPVVQGGATKQVSVANLTAGRSLSASGVTVTGLTASKPVFTDGSSALTSSGTVPTNQGGTGLTSFTAAGVMYATSTSALSTASGVTTDGTNLGVGVTVPTGYKLDVRSSSNSVALFYQTGAGNNTDIYVDNVNSAGNFLISRRSNGEAWLYTSSTNPIVMYTQGAERLNVQSGGDVKFTTGNLVQGTAAKGVTTGGAFSLGLGTNGSTTQASLDTSGNLKVGSGSALTKLDVAGSIAPTNAPSSNWGLDFAPSTSSGTYITIANNATYDLAVGSGMVFLLDQNGNGFGQLASYYGNTYIVWQSGTLYTTTSGTANKVNFFYNAGTGKYRVENKFGISLDLWVSTIKMRNVS